MRLIVLCSLLVSGAVWGQGVPPNSRRVEVGGSVQAFPPDGGTQVTLAGERVDANITNEYVAVAGDAFGARVPIVGPVSFDVPQEVVLTGTPTVNLTPAMAAALAGERDCIDYGVGNVTIDAGVYEFISVEGQQTAAITIHNCGVAVDYASCFRSWLPDGGPPPSCALGTGVANVPIHNGETWVVDGLADHHRLRCLACTHAGPPSGGTCLAGGTISICTPSP